MSIGRVVILYLYDLDNMMFPIIVINGEILMMPKRKPIFLGFSKKEQSFQ
jgi:hypothetical protein